MNDYNMKLKQGLVQSTFGLVTFWFWRGRVLSFHRLLFCFMMVVTMYPPSMVINLFRNSASPLYWTQQKAKIQHALAFDPCSSILQSISQKLSSYLNRQKRFDELIHLKWAVSQLFMIFYPVHRSDTIMIIMIITSLWSSRTEFFLL